MSLGIKSVTRTFSEIFFFFFIVSLLLILPFRSVVTCTSLKFRFHQGLVIRYTTERMTIFTKFLTVLSPRTHREVYPTSATKNMTTTDVRPILTVNGRMNLGIPLLSLWVKIMDYTWFLLRCKRSKFE